MDPRIALAWLKSEPRHSLICPSCNGVFGSVKVRVGLTLITEFDVDELETVIVPKAFAYLDRHRCALAPSEAKMLLKDATEWAEDNFQVFTESYAGRPLLDSPDTVTI